MPSWKVMSSNPNERKEVQWAAQHRGSIHASHPADLGSTLGIPKNYYLDVAQIY